MHYGARDEANFTSKPFPVWPFCYYMSASRLPPRSSVSKKIVTVVVMFPVIDVLLWGTKTEQAAQTMPITLETML